MKATEGIDLILILAAHLDLLTASGRLVFLGELEDGVRRMGQRLATVLTMRCCMMDFGVRYEGEMLSIFGVVRGVIRWWEGHRGTWKREGGYSCRPR